MSNDREESIKEMRLPVIELAVMNVQGYKDISDVDISELLEHPDKAYFEATID